MLSQLLPILRKVVHQLRAYFGFSIPYAIREGARLRPAWTEVNHCHELAGKHETVPPDSADMEELIPANLLSGMRRNFWKRYQTNLEDWQALGDRTLSKLYKDLERRQHKPPDLAKITSLQDEGLADRVRKEIAKGLHFTVGEGRVRREGYP